MFRNIKRAEEILSLLVKHGFGFFLRKAKITHLLPRHKIRNDNSLEEEISPRDLKNLIEDLGGIFLKLGQLLSLRPDLIPKEYCDELSKLQDSVKPMDFKEVKKILQGKVHNLIIEKKPLASASIAQVHIGEYKNKKVAVKIRRPKEKFEEDLEILSTLAKLMKKTYKNISFDPVEIIEEFRRYTIEEFDFNKEADNIRLFYKNFYADNNVKIPLVYFSSKDILIMELLHGEPITSIKDKRDSYKKRILSLYLSTMLKQIFKYGRFHADPHPGNVFVKRNQLLFLDFGIIGTISNEDKRKIKKMFIAILEKDTSLIAKILVSMKILKSHYKDGFERDLKENFAKYYDSEISTISINGLFNSLFNVIRKNRIKLPPHFVLLGKSLMTTESVIQEIDPSFNIIEESIKFAKRERLFYKEIINSLNQFKNFFISIPEKTDDLSVKIDEFNDNINLIHNDISQLNRTIDRSVKTISLSLLFISFLFIGYLMSNRYSIFFYGLSIFIILVLLYDFLKR